MLRFPSQSILVALVAMSLLSLPACGGGGSTTVGGGGGGGGGGGATFRLVDLEGDWLGQLQPTALGGNARNFYLRFENGELTSAAESDGGEWTDAVASMGFAFSSKGVLKTDLLADVGSSRLLLSGQMNSSLSAITGTFTVRSTSGQKTTGSFTLTLSNGAAQFNQDMLTGRWDGLGQGGSGKFRFLKFELDANGAVLSGQLKHPDTQALIRTYAPGSATFGFFDTSIGRIENVVMLANSGHTITFRYLLMNVDGTLVAGPGEESGLGAGIAELVPGI